MNHELAEVLSWTGPELTLEEWSREVVVVESRSSHFTFVPRRSASSSTTTIRAEQCQVTLLKALEVMLEHVTALVPESDFPRRAYDRLMYQGASKPVAVRLRSDLLMLADPDAFKAVRVGTQDNFGFAVLVLHTDLIELARV